MFHYKNSKIIKVDIKKSLEVILNVQNYPKFIPWCSDAKITKKTKNIITADLIVSYAGIHKKYSSETRITYRNKKVDIKTYSSDKAFKFLNSRWCLTELKKNETAVLFEIHFDLNSFFLRSLMKNKIEKATKKILDSFEAYISE